MPATTPTTSGGPTTTTSTRPTTTATTAVRRVAPRPSAPSATDGERRLAWTAPGDDWMCGKADLPGPALRPRSTQPADGTVIAGSATPPPAPAGTTNGRAGAPAEVGGANYLAVLYRDERATGAASRRRSLAARRDRRRRRLPRLRPDRGRATTCTAAPMRGVTDGADDAPSAGDSGGEAGHAAAAATKAIRRRPATTRSAGACARPRSTGRLRRRRAAARRRGPATTWPAARATTDSRLGGGDDSLNGGRGAAGRRHRRRSSARRRQGRTSTAAAQRHASRAAIASTSAAELRDARKARGGEAERQRRLASAWRCAALRAGPHSGAFPYTRGGGRRARLQGLLPRRRRSPATSGGTRTS